MEICFLTQVPIHLCIQYLKNKNVNDVFEYKFEEIDEAYFITFLEYRNSWRSLKNCPKPCFSVVFVNNDNKTIIKVKFVKKFYNYFPFGDLRKMEEFWRKKLNAVVIERNL